MVGAPLLAAPLLIADLQLHQVPQSYIFNPVATIATHINHTYLYFLLAHTISIPFP